MVCRETTGLKILKHCGVNLGIYILANEVRILVGRDLVRVRAAEQPEGFQVSDKRQCHVSLRRCTFLGNISENGLLWTWSAVNKQINKM